MPPTQCRLVHLDVDHASVTDIEVIAERSEVAVRFLTVVRRLGQADPPMSGANDGGLRSDQQEERGAERQNEETDERDDDEAETCFTRAGFDARVWLDLAVGVIEYAFLDVWNENDTGCLHRRNTPRSHSVTTTPPQNRQRPPRRPPRLNAPTSSRPGQTPRFVDVKRRRRVLWLRHSLWAHYDGVTLRSSTPSRYAAHSSLSARNCRRLSVVANTISLFSRRRDFSVPIPSSRMSYLTRRPPSLPLISDTGPTGGSTGFTRSSPKPYFE